MDSPSGAAQNQQTAPEARAARNAVDVGMRAMGLASGAFLLPLAILPLVLIDRERTGDVAPATWGLALAEVLVVLAMWLRPRSARCLWATGAMMLGATLWWMPQRLTMASSNWWAPGFWIIPWVCWSVTLLRRSVFGTIHAVVLLVLTVLDPLTQWRSGHPITGLTLAPIPWFVAPVTMMGLFGYRLHRLAILADRQVDRRLAAEHDRDQGRAAGDSRREAARLLHDHVLHALHAISHQSSVVRSEMVVGECRDAVTAVDQARSAQGTAQLAELLADDPAVAAAGATIQGGTRPLPSEVARAFAAATHEALMNAARHAKARTVTVRMHELDDQWHVEVSDDGRGFDASAAPAAGRLGLRNSIVERMADAGGSAVVESAPGRGTVVRLAWPDLEPRPADSLWPQMGDANLGRTLAWTAWPPMAVMPFMLAMASPLIRPAWPLQLVTIGLILLGCWWLLRLRTHVMGTFGQAFILVVTSLAWWLNLWMSPDHPTSVYTLWVGWAGACLVHQAILQVRFRRGIAYLAGWNLVQFSALVLRHGWGDLWRLQITLTTGLAECSVALVALRVARRVVEHNTRQAEITRATQRAVGRARVELHLEEFWSDRVTDVALPLLQAIADGKVDPAEATVRDRARQLEATLRDELVLGRSQAVLLDSIGLLRAQGWVVRSSLDPQLGSTVLDTFGRNLRQLGAPVTAGQQVTLSANATHGMAVVLSASREQVERWTALLPQLGGACYHDPDFVRLSIPLPGHRTDS